MVEEKINTTIKNALAIRHRITHDANYLVKFDARLFHETECVFQVIPQLLTIKLAEKYDQKRMVFNLKHNAVRLTNLPDTDEKPYIFSAGDIIAQDYYILK